MDIVLFWTRLLRGVGYLDILCRVGYLDAMAYTATQIHPTTGQIIRQVRVLRVQSGTATVVALNGPMRGVEYHIPAQNLRR